MLIYDGDCAFCTSSAAWIARLLPPDTPVVPWQSIDDLGAYDLTETDVRTAAYWVDDRGVAHRGHRAVARSLIAAGGVWGLAGRSMLVPPVACLAAGGYHVVAGNRHRLPGSTEACHVDARSDSDA